MINFIHLTYIPNTASTNRLLAYLNNIPSNCPVTVYFILPSVNLNKITNPPPNVKIIYCWEKFPNISKLSKVLLYYRSLLYIKNKLNNGDIVYAYNVPKYLGYFHSKNIKVFSERTEYPLINNYSSKLIKTSYKKHIKICKSLDGLFVISEPLRQFYIAEGLDNNKIHIINMIVDVSRFANGAPHAPNERYLAYCGNVSNNKDGVDKLIRSFSIITKSHPDIKLCIIGKLPNNESKDSNIELINSLGLYDKIIFTGLLDANEVIKKISGAIALLLNRPDNIQAKYGFPTKLGEYLMTGKPVVVTDVGDIKKFLTDGESAFIADPNDNVDFAEKVIWILDNPDKANEIGIAGKAVAIRYFNAIFETQKLFSYLNNQLI